jgi:HEXXH motif-containing protein
LVQSPSETSGLLLPDASHARLIALRRAEAFRLLKAHAAAGDIEVASALAELARSAKEEAADVLMDPAAAVLARSDRFALAGDAWMFELAHRGHLKKRFVMRGQQVISLPLRLSLTWPQGVRVTLSAKSLELQGGGPLRSLLLAREALFKARDPRLTVTTTFHTLRDKNAEGEILLALDDPNPLAMVEAHPDKDGNALSLGDHALTEWTQALGDALSILEAHLPGVVSEMRLLSLLTIPVGYHAEKHVSASYREYVGACYLTLHPNVHTLAEALVHEFQHNKANLASHHDPLLENAQGTLVRSPVRPDLRPLWGVLLAVHAFVPVAELFLRMWKSGSNHVRDRLRDVIQKNEEGLQTLREHARPTRIGAMLIEEMSDLHAVHRAVELGAPKGSS